MDACNPFDAAHVVITKGTVETATVTDEWGTRPDLSDVGKTLFFVDVVEKSGARVGMWSGKDHAAALEEARFLAKDFGGIVKDTTDGSDGEGFVGL